MRLVVALIACGLERWGRIVGDAEEHGIRDIRTSGRYVTAGKSLTVREKLTILQQEEEEKARQLASSITRLSTNASRVPLVTGTLAETKAATTNWGNEPSREEVEKMMRDKALDRLASFISNHHVFFVSG
ncbi:hypothetical protein RIF29_00209 [Crotalaria pallida]|uniref:Uncharacterized protein n=1 Tax=Crotalaria pallida TaxID=3830 RepID=A0AAN9IX95_CROPI